VLPSKPYCTDELGSLFIRPKETAVKRRYIQQNSPFDLHWLVYDVDRPASHYDWQDLYVPAPNITVTNLTNGHSHLLYGLEVPVIKCVENPKVHSKPLHFAASIDVALCLKLDADPGYVGLICKNPLHNSWHVSVWERALYDLPWIADYLDLKPYRDRRKRLPPIGLGRNCTIFELTRRWAYKERRKANLYTCECYFIEAVICYAVKKNECFTVPLPYSEIKATGKSVGRWTWRNMSPEGFSGWCSYRGKAGNIKSLEVRQAKSAERAKAIRAYKQEYPEMSNREIAKVFEVSHFTVNQAIKSHC
jgi:hypothetical protein